MAAMASILCVVPSESVKKSVLDTLEEHRGYYEKVFNATEYVRPEILVELDGGLVDMEAYNPDIIIARGMTAYQIKKRHPDTPVVEIPLTSADIVEAVRQFGDEAFSGTPVALIGFANSRCQAKAAESLLDLRIVPFDHSKDKLNAQYLASLIDRIKAEGIRHLLGGVRTVEAAKQRGMKAVFVSSGPESIWLALTEAQHISAIHRTERERAARFSIILDHSREGIVTTDRMSNVIQINAQARAALGLDAVDCVGKNVADIIREPKFLELVEDAEDRRDELVKIGRKKIVVTKTAASLGAETVGHVIAFQDITNVRDTEIKIRSKLHERGLVAKYSFDDIIGESQAMRTAIDNAKIFARTLSNVLILGETGTGKELFSQSVHNHSERRDGPFVAVNCAAIPESLMESEFFGYARGAFTDAAKEGKMGYFELAHGGTLFLDEVSEIPINLQGKLLRVLQENEVMPVGGDKVIPVDVRIVCASNKDLKPLMKLGKFREDLYYRLAVLQLRLPPLRERGGDILLFADKFLNETRTSRSRRKLSLSPDLADRFLRGPWDGNVRELRNACEQLSALNETGVVTLEEAASIFPEEGGREVEAEKATPARPRSARLCDDVRMIEEQRIRQALAECAFKRTLAARRLGIDRATLWRKMKEYNIELTAAGMNAGES